MRAASRVSRSLLKSNKSATLLKNRCASRGLRYASSNAKQSYRSDSHMWSLRSSALAGGLIVGAATLGMMAQDNAISNGGKTDGSKPPVSPSQVAEHSSPDDCWVVIEGYVYNLTDFISAHPGGPAIIQNNAGKDVTAIFGPIHAPDVIEKYIAPENRIGPLDGKMPEDLICAPLTPGETPEDVARKEELRQMMPDLDLSLIHI